MMQGMTQKKEELLPKIMWLPLFFTLAANTLAYYGSRLLTGHRVHYNLTNALDECIPFVPWTVSIYLGCYLFWIVNYVIGCRQRRELAFRLLGADLIAKLVCLLCFLAFPTTNTRPLLEGTGFWMDAMRFLYGMDAADNLFPSIHCLTSTFCYLAVRENEQVPRWYRKTSLVITAAICISTLTTRQHVLIDVAGGIGLAVGSYVFVEKSGFGAWYAAATEKLYAKMRKCPRAETDGGGIKRGRQNAKYFMGMPFDDLPANGHNPKEGRDFLSAGK